MENESDAEKVDDANSDADGEGSDEEHSKSLHGLSGMADVISKIISKNIPDEKNLVLSKYKKAERQREVRTEDFAAKKARLDAKHAFEEKCHVLPSRSNSQKEVLLRRIATKGVVKLFNAVSAHQKLISETSKAAKTEARRSKAVDAVNKSSFLELLKEEHKKGDSAKPNVHTAVEAKKKSSKRVSSDSNQPQVAVEPSWKVLRDDFMLGASLKDWDKADECSRSSDGNEEQADSDSDSVG